MLQKYIISVDLDKPLAKFGDNHVLVWDKSTNTYSVASEESFLSPQNRKIKKIEDDFESLKKAMNSVLKETIKVQNEFIVDITEKMNKKSLELDNKFDEFLKTYKTTNSKMIKMIEELVIGGNKDE